MEFPNCFVFSDRQSGKITYIPFHAVTHIEINKSRELVSVFYGNEIYKDVRMNDEIVSNMLKSYSEWLKNR